MKGMMKEFGSWQASLKGPRVLNLYEPFSVNQKSASAAFPNWSI